MRFIIFVNGTAESDAGGVRADEILREQMSRYHGELARAGALLDASGLHPSSTGWRVRVAEGQRTLTDGPFADSKGVIAAYTIIQVSSREEALEWSRRFPVPEGADGEIEVRQLFELDDLQPGLAADRFRLPALPNRV